MPHNQQKKRPPASAIGLQNIEKFFTPAPKPVGEVLTAVRACAAAGAAEAAGPAAQDPAVCVPGARHGGQAGYGASADSHLVHSCAYGALQVAPPQAAGAAAEAAPHPARGALVGCRRLLCVHMPCSAVAPVAGACLEPCCIACFLMRGCFQAGAH